jgi:5-dehydro-2-deoxygluconokinase
MTTLLKPPVYMLAIDHRWQWERWCDEHGVARTRIPEVKLIAAEAFLAACARSSEARASGALLVDLTYGREAFVRVRDGGARTGNPAERAGAFPLEWTGAFEDALPGGFVKVLVRHRADTPPDVQASQLSKLLDLQTWCARAGKPLVVEVLVSAATEDAAFEHEGRPRILAEYIRRAYGEGLVPAFWKIEGVPDAEAMRPIDEAILERDGPRQLILGKGAGLDLVGQWFDAARGAASPGGFAIGRTAYWQAACEYLEGRADRQTSQERMVTSYLAIVDRYRRALGVEADAHA